MKQLKEASGGVKADEEDEDAEKVDGYVGS